MVCWTQLKPNQTVAQRAEEVRELTRQIDRLVAQGTVRAVIGPQGAIAFDGLSREQRDGLTDACIYRQLSRTGSHATQAQITAAERQAGRTVDRKVVAHGEHSHDGGRTWEHGHSRQLGRGGR